MEFTKQLKEDQERIEKELKTYSEMVPAFGRQREAMAYSLLSGGKRIRPVLTLAVCRMFGGRAEDALTFACALEMVHTYSLIHDDLPCMDDDDFRRGKPTSHRVFGEAFAVLAGDGLLTYAFDVLSGANLPEGQILRGIRCLAKAAGPAGMVGGQVLDLLGEGKTLTHEEIIEIESLKTGCMIEAAARLGAIAAGSTPEQEEAAAAYARAVGLAFQIRDDVLDVLGDAREFGKPIGSDEEKGKSTFVGLLGLDACGSMVTDLTAQAISCIREYDNSAFLVELATMLASRRK